MIRSGEKWKKKLFIIAFLFSLLLGGCANSGDDAAADAADSWDDADYAEMDKDYDYVDDSYEDEYEDEYDYVSSENQAL